MEKFKFFSINLQFSQICCYMFVVRIFKRIEL